MTTLTLLGDVVIFVAGGAFVWFFKTTIQKWVIGANALSAKLHAQANAISTEVSTIKKAL